MDVASTPSPAPLVPGATAPGAADDAFPVVFDDGCALCPRRCGAARDRAAGFCGESSTLRIASYGRHFGEEPCFTGAYGSGAFFFSGCPCHCFFCQNAQISLPDGLGHPVTDDQFHDMALRLIAEHAVNLNFVTPDHVWPHVEALCRRLRDRDGATLPFLFNSSGYHAEALLDRALATCDIFLPDFKFCSPALAAEVMGDARYPEIALRALDRILGAKGFLTPFDPSGTTPAREGLLVRHLVLPGHAEDSLELLALLRREFGPLLPLSLMSQYTPTPAAIRRGAPWNRALDPTEYSQVIDAAESLGFENVFIQPLGSIPPGPAATTPDPFLPDFSSAAPFPGNPVPPPFPAS